MRSPLRTTAGSTPQLSGAALRLRERKRLHDTAILMSLAVMFAAVFLVWYLRVLEVPLRPVAWGFLGFWLAYLAAGTYTDGLRTIHGLIAAHQVLQVSVIAYLICLWHQLGGIRNLAFLMVLVVPVVISGVLMQRWQPYVTAGLGSAAVWCATIVEDSSFRWYLSQYMPLLRGLPGMPEAEFGSGSTILPDVQLTPSLTLTALMMFTLVEILAAFLTESLSATVAKQQARSVLAENMSTDSEGILQGALKAVPVPTVLVDAATAQVMGASESFLRQMVLNRSDLEGRNLFDLLDFERPHDVRELFERQGGVLPECRFGVGGERRLGRVWIETFVTTAGRYASVVVQDQSDENSLGGGEASPRLPKAISG
jgi:PAS domain-containing protein